MIFKSITFDDIAPAVGGVSTGGESSIVTPQFDYSQIISEAVKAQVITSQIMPQVRDEIKKSGWRQIPNAGAARGAKTWFYDPLTLQYSLGYKDRRFSLTYDMLKKMASQLAIISAIVNTRCTQISSFAQPYRTTRDLGFTIKHKDADHATTSAEKEHIKDLEKFIMNCGSDKQNPYSKHKRDDLEDFLKKVVRDSLIYDQVCVEVVPDGLGMPYEFLAIDASTIRIASDDRYVGVNSSYHERGGFTPAVPGRFANLYEGRHYGRDEVTTASGEPISYIQLVNGQIDNVYGASELIFGVRNPRTDIYIQGYGYGELEQLITIITAHLYAEEYNRKFFSQGCVAGDTKVFTNNGIVPIKDLPISNEGFEPCGKVWNGTDWVDFDVVYTGEKEEYEVLLNTGSSLRVSKDHKFPVLQSDGTTSMITVEEINDGDYIPQSRAFLEFGKKSTDISLRVSNKSGVKESNSVKCSDDLVEIVGWAVGDGWFSERKIPNKTNSYNRGLHLLYAPKEMDVFKRHVDLLEGLGLSCRVRDKKCGWGDGFVKEVTITNRMFFLDITSKLGIIPNTKAPQKRVPVEIFSMSSGARAAFLRGLFGADGHVKTLTKGSEGAKASYLTSSSKLLLEDSQMLLFSLGMHSKIELLMVPGQYDNGAKNNIYKLSVADNKRFFEIVGFACDHKVDGNRLKSYDDRKDGGPIPEALAKSVCAVLEAADGFDSLDNNRKMNIKKVLRPEQYSHKGSVSRHNLTMMCQKLGVSGFKELLSYRWVRVESVVSTGLRVPMFDIREIDEKHTWSAGLVLTKNSAPKGLLNLKGDNWTPDQLEDFQRQWQAQVSGNDNAWKTPVLQSEGLEWIDLNKTNREMEFGQWMEYLIKITTGVYMIDPAELNFDLSGGVSQTPLFESSSEWKLKASRDRGLKPLLRFFAKMLNKNIIDKIDDHFTLEFTGLDEISEQEQHEMLMEQLAGYRTMNEVRRELDLPDLPHGDMPMNPTYLDAVRLANETKQMEQQEAGGEMGAEGEEPQEEGELPGGDPMVVDEGPQYSDQFGMGNPAEAFGEGNN